MTQKSQILKSLKSLQKWLKETHLDFFDLSTKMIKHVEEFFPEDDQKVKPRKSKSLHFSQTGDFPKPDYCQSEYDFAIFSDGACRGNPGPGAWSNMAQNQQGEILFQSASFEEQTTNNRMELSGSLEGLKQFLDYAEEFKLSLNKVKIYVVSDSRYVVDGMNSWVKGWKDRGWKKADNKTPENIDLWKALDSVKEKIGNIEFKWVKGHAEHPQNEYCDRMCNELLDRELSGGDEEEKVPSRGKINDSLH